MKHCDCGQPLFGFYERKQEKCDDCLGRQYAEEATLDGQTDKEIKDEVN